TSRRERTRSVSFRSWSRTLGTRGPRRSPPRTYLLLLPPVHNRRHHLRRVEGDQAAGVPVAALASRSRGAMADSAAGTSGRAEPARTPSARGRAPAPPATFTTWVRARRRGKLGQGPPALRGSR